LGRFAPPRGGRRVAPREASRRPGRHGEIAEIRPRPRTLTPDQAAALLDLVDAERAAARALNTAVETGAVTGPDAVRLFEHHDAVGAALRTLVGDLRLRGVKVGRLVHDGYVRSIPAAPDAVDGTVAVYKPTRMPPEGGAA